MLNLRIERELRGISLEEMSDSTKIPVSQLEALENRAYDKLPSQIFIKSHLKAYSDYLGLDFDWVLLEFDLLNQFADNSRKAENISRYSPFHPLPVIIFIILIIALTLIFGEWQKTMHE